MRRKADNVETSSETIGITSNEDQQTISDCFKLIQYRTKGAELTIRFLGVALIVDGGPNVNVPSELRSYSQQKAHTRSQFIQYDESKPM
jgi:hypothetical protein